MRLKSTLLILCLLFVSLFLTSSQAEAKSCSGQNSSSLSANKYEKALVCLTNKVRKAHNKSRLRTDKKLAKAAQNHTNYMVKKDCFDHHCKGEPDLDNRLFKVGYLKKGKMSSWAYGENIAYGYSSPKEMMKAWMNSPGHRANLLSSNFKEIGIGVKMKNGRPWATQDFGKVKGF